MLFRVMELILDVTTIYAAKELPMRVLAEMECLKKKKNFFEGILLSAIFKCSSNQYREYILVYS